MDEELMRFEMKVELDGLCLNGVGEIIFVQELM